MEPVVHTARFDELDVTTLYELLALRAAVFVVEQDCPYLDPDGRDSEPGTLHLWATGETGEVLATLRVLDEGGGGRRIGRVVTAPQARGAGLAARLMEQALACCDGDVVLDAQTWASEWYARFGFQVCGPEFLDDGIPHVPMHRPAGRAPSR